VHEDLEIGACFVVNGGNFFEGQFACQRDAMCALFQRERNTVGARDTGLGGSMEFQVRSDLTREAKNTEVLHNERIDTCFGDRSDGASGLGKFVFEDQRIEREITANAPAMERAHYFRKFSEIESYFRPRTEMFEAEVACVGTCFDGGIKLRPMSGGTHDFGFHIASHRLKADLD
jgi:hypothetical protein